MKYIDYNPEFEVVTEETGRVYTTEGISFPSVTTVLGHSTKDIIKKWKARVGDKAANSITSKAGVIGNALHDACEVYLSIRNNPEELEKFLADQKRNPFHFSQFKKVQQVLDSNISDVFLSEVFLYSHDLRMAGRCDLVANFAGKKCMIDFKTSGSQLIDAKIKKYKLQVLSYIIMHNTIFTEEEPITDGIIISAPRTDARANVLVFENLAFDNEMISLLHDTIKDYENFQIQPVFD